MSPEDADRKIKAAWSVWTQPARSALHQIEADIKRLESEYHRQASDMLAMFRKTHPDYQPDWLRIRQGHFRY